MVHCVVYLYVFMIGNSLLCVLRLSESKLSELYCRAAMSAGRSSHDKVVCPFICLSVCQTHDLSQNEKKCAHILIQHENHLC